MEPDTTRDQYPHEVAMAFLGEVCLKHARQKMTVFEPAEGKLATLVPSKPACPLCCAKAALEMEDDAKRYFSSLLINGMGAEAAAERAAQVEGGPAELTLIDRLLTFVHVIATLKGVSFNKTIGDLLEDSAQPPDFWAKWFA